MIHSIILQLNIQVYLYIFKKVVIHLALQQIILQILAYNKYQYLYKSVQIFSLRMKQPENKRAYSEQPRPSFEFIPLQTLSKKNKSKCIAFLWKDIKMVQKTVQVTDQKLPFLKKLVVESYSFKQMNFKSLEGYLIIDRLLIARCDYLEEIKKVDNLGLVMERLILELIKASNCRFYTYDNIFVTYDLRVKLNETSFAGILTLAYQEDFQVKELREVYQLLTNQLFQTRNGDNKFTIPWKIKLRSIGMMILYALFGKKFSLLPKNLLERELITRKEVIELVKQLNQKFLTTLSNKDVRKIIEKAQERDEISYGIFLEQVFINNSKNMNWERAIQYLVPRYAEKSQIQRFSAQNTVSNSMNTTESSQNGSQLRCYKLIIEEIDEYYYNFANRGKLQQMGISQQLFRYLKLQIPNFRLNLYQSILSQDYGQAMNTFICLSQIINENEKMKRMEFKEQRKEVNLQQMQKSPSTSDCSNNEKKSLKFQPNPKWGIIQQQNIQKCMSCTYNHKKQWGEGEQTNLSTQKKSDFKGKHQLSQIKNNQKDLQNSNEYVCHDKKSKIQSQQNQQQLINRNNACIQISEIEQYDGELNHRNRSQQRYNQIQLQQSQGGDYLNQGLTDDNQISQKPSKKVKQFPIQLLRHLGKRLLSVPLGYNGSKLEGINNKMMMMNKYLKL